MRPRIRTLKPESWQDERVGTLSHGARLLFVGLITMADDEGRLRELFDTIRGHIFPYDGISNKKLQGWLEEVAATGMVVRYEVNGQRLLAFRRWSKHQKVDKPSRSELPPPPVDFAEDSPNDRGMVADHSRPARTRASGPIPSSPVVVPEKDKRQGHARELFDYWRERCRHPDAKPTRERLTKISARLDEGYTVEQVREAIDGAARGAYVNEAGKRFDDIELICRNGSKLESFIDRATAKPHLTAVPSRPPTAGDLIQKINAAEAARKESA